MWIEKYKYFLIAILVGICMMLIDFPKNEETSEISAENTMQIDIKQELEEVLSQIDGVGRVSVMLTMHSSIEHEYVKDESISENESSYEVKEETILLSKQGGGEEPIKIKDIYPLYKGALIVCDGGSEPVIKLEIMRAVSSLLNISSDKISITKMKE